MTQLSPDTGSAVGGDPVEQTDASDAAIGPTHDVAEAPETQEQEEPELAETLYPDDQQDDQDTADDSDPDEDSDPNVNDEGDEDTDGEDEPDEPAIKPPHSWKAEEKERWDSLPRETQEYLSEREAERERFVNSKAQEAAQVKDQITRQAEAELAQFSEQQAQQYQLLAQQFFPPEPDDKLLFTGNPDDQLRYQQQQAQYRQGLAQQQRLQQAAKEHADRAQQIRDDQEKLAIQQDVQRLQTELPEWFDESSKADLEKNLTAIAKDLGYPDELLPEANSSDLLALKKAHSWKEKADKWDAYQKAKMKPVREAKKRPPVPNKPGSPVSGGNEAKTAAELLYPDDVRK